VPARIQKIEFNLHWHMAAVDFIEMQDRPGASEHVQNEDDDCPIWATAYAVEATVSDYQDKKFESQNPDVGDIFEQVTRRYVFNSPRYPMLDHRLKC